MALRLSLLTAWLAPWPLRLPTMPLHGGWEGFSSCLMGQRLLHRPFYVTVVQLLSGDDYRPRFFCLYHP